jgi:nitrogen-specific signal transduction histidine kinase
MMKLTGKRLDEGQVEVAQTSAAAVQMLAEVERNQAGNQVEILVVQVVETLEVLETFVDRNWDLMKSDLTLEHPQTADIPY